jgi:glycine cleavage system H protein
MTALLVVLTIMVAVAIDVLLVARRKRLTRATVSDRPVPIREPSIPHGLFLDDGHAWARLTTEGTLRIGVDDLIAQALGNVEAVTTVARGSRVKRGEPILTLRVKGRDLRVAAPVAGRVVAINDNLRARPWLLVRDPYGAGWGLALWSRDLKEVLKPLRIGGSAVAFLREELSRFIDFLVGASRLEEATVLADGGVPRVGALQALDDEGWRRFESGFLRPSGGEE